VIYRLVDMVHPTLLLDEADARLLEGSDQRAVIDSGHKATSVIHRNVEINGEWVPHEFSSFCPIAIAAIGRLPRTIDDRSIKIRMRKAMRGEIRRDFRPALAMKAFEPNRRRAMRFAVDNMERLAACDPQLPPGAFNRFADNWRPLAALAQAAGGDWPERVRDAILADLGNAEDDELGQRCCSKTSG
jgi:Protein of unknown function (DUF3631)